MHFLIDVEHVRNRLIMSYANRDGSANQEEIECNKDVSSKVDL